MAQIVKEISVDVAKRNLFQAIVAKQHDSNSRFLKVTLVNEGEPILVDTTSVVTINACRADGSAGAFAGVVNGDGTVTVPLTNWMLELDDTVKCDITVVDAESRKLTSTSFELEVETAAYGDSEIKDDENYDLLVTLLVNVADVTGECQAATEAANSAAQFAEQAMNMAYAAAENANSVAAHLPTISDNGYWMLWDVEKGTYVETTHYAGGNSSGGGSITATGVGDTVVITTSLSVTADGDAIIIGG